MYFKMTVAAATAVATALLAEIDDGPDPAEIMIYTGAPPATVETAVTTQTLLGTLVCSDPVGSVSGRVLTFDVITQDSSADAGGTAAWARILDGNGTAIVDVDVTNNAGSGAIKLNTVTIVAAGPIQLTSFTITVGA